jgi:SAM-dependent methyltransferase
MSTDTDENILRFWNERSTLGQLAGTNDFVLTEIEQRFLVDFVPTGACVLDIGCGNGGSLIRMAKEKGIAGIGLDFSDEMVKTAREAVQAEGLGERISIHHRSVPPVAAEWGKLPIVFSQRCLINLKTVEAQREAVLSVAEVLEPGGIYIMLECFNEGSEETNLLRLRLGLETMHAPWHNRFFDLHQVKSWSSPQFYVERVVHISSTYHFLSRVVYAALAQKSGEQLRYDSDINLLAKELPQEIGEFGPVKACIWRKAK